jgi:hypothetical protein
MRTFCTCLAVFTLLALPISAIAQTTAYSYEGTWEGTYTAAQGITRVVLVIQPLDESHIRGHYLFYADNSNEKVPSGYYTIAGSVDSASGKLSFDGSKWIRQPEFYIFVGFSGSLVSDGATYSGDVTTELQGKVGTFMLTRLSSCYEQGVAGVPRGGK